jgi:hypothetical protein
MHGCPRTAGQYHGDGDAAFAGKGKTGGFYKIEYPLVYLTVIP